MADRNAVDRESGVMLTIQNPSSQEWSSVRSKFTQLYCFDRKTLKEARQQLQEEDNFSASINAFKRKIKDWSLRRSYTAAEKDLFCQHVTDESSQASGPSSSLIHRKPIDQSKIRRHQATRRRKLAHLTILALSSTTVPVAIIDDPQKVLRATQDLWLHQVGSAIANGWNPGWCDMSLVSDLTDVAIYLSLPDGRLLAESTMRNFCCSLNQLMVHQPMSVLLAVFELILNPRWLPHPKTQANLYGSISKKVMACEQIDPHLYHVFCSMQSLDSMRLIMPQMALLQAQTLLDRFATHTDQLLGLLTDIVLNLVHCREISEALRLACAIPQTTELSHMKKGEAWLLISRCQLEFGAYHDAIVNGNKVLQHCEPFVAAHDKSYAYTYINTCDVMARCCDALSDIENVIIHRTRAYTTALEIFGTHASNTVYHQAKLKHSMEQFEQQRRPRRAAPESIPRLVVS